MPDQTQAKLTQRILDSLGDGLEVGVSGHVLYGQRRGEIKAFWSFCKFDQNLQPQEISKLQPQPLYSFKDFVRGVFFVTFLLVYLSMSVQHRARLLDIVIDFVDPFRNIGLY